MASALTLYIQNTFKLAKTIVVKHNMIAKAMNDAAIRKGYSVNQLDPSSWRYYMNLSGQYHQYDKDLLSNLSAGLDAGAVHEYMQVNIAGDEGPVQTDFTFELISGPDADPATAAEYRYGQSFYTELVKRYPDFETLILGIIYPVDINILIDAYDGEILYCGGYLKTLMNDGSGRYYYQQKIQSVFETTPLLEFNEEQMIPKLQHYINAFCTRWINQDFIKVEDLYVPAVWGIVFPHMPAAIMNIRQDAAFSSKANSFHVYAHLESHGFLGSIPQHLPLPVVMWMYRNVAWLEANVGKQKTFDAIVTNVFTPCNIPIRKFILKHNNEVLPDSNVPETLGYAVPLNLSGVGIVEQDSHTIAELLEKEIPLARDNNYDPEADAADLQFRASRGRAAVYDTKLLESVLVDYSNFIPYKLEDILVNLWAYSIAKGSYHGTAYVTHPLTGDRLQFTMMNAFILMVYCYNKGYKNNTPEKILPVTVRMIPRELSYIPAPGFSVRSTFDDLKDRVEARYVSDDQLKNMIGTRSPVYSFANSTAFYTESYAQWAEMNRQFYLHDNCPWLSRSLYLEGVMRRLYWCNLKLDLPETGSNYAAWLLQMNLNLDGLSQADYLNLMTQLFMYGTGYNNNHERDLTSMQATCIQILQQFTSYSTHIVSNRGSGAPEFSHDTPMKVDIIELAGEATYYLPQIMPDIELALDIHVLAKADVDPTLNSENVTFTSQLQMLANDPGVLDTGTYTEQTIFVPLINVDNQFLGFFDLPPVIPTIPLPIIGYTADVNSDGVLDDSEYQGYAFGYLEAPANVDIANDSITIGISGLFAPLTIPLSALVDPVTRRFPLGFQLPNGTTLTITANFVVGGVDGPVLNSSITGRGMGITLVGQSTVSSNIPNSSFQNPQLINVAIHAESLGKHWKVSSMADGNGNATLPVTTGIVSAQDVANGYFQTSIPLDYGISFDLQPSLSVDGVTWVDGPTTGYWTVATLSTMPEASIDNSTTAQDLLTTIVNQYQMPLLIKFPLDGNNQIGQMPDIVLQGYTGYPFLQQTAPVAITQSDLDAGFMNVQYYAPWGQTLFVVEGNNGIHAIGHLRSQYLNNPDYGTSEFYAMPGSPPTANPGIPSINLNHGNYASSIGGLAIGWNNVVRPNWLTTPGADSTGNIPAIPITDWDGTSDINVYMHMNNFDVADPSQIITGLPYRVNLGLAGEINGTLTDSDIAAGGPTITLPNVTHGSVYILNLSITTGGVETPMSSGAIQVT